MPDPPDPNPFVALHEQLLAGNRLASDTLTCLVLSSLIEETTRKFPHLDEQMVCDGVIDAVLDYCAAPQQFDVGRNVPLDRFLATNAWRNVANLLRGERRRKDREHAVGRENPESDVALDPVAGNIQREEQQEIDARKSAMLAVLDNATDREILSLYLEGERDTAAFACVLKITHLSPDQQRADVRRHKDRIKRYLRRKGLLP